MRLTPATNARTASRLGLFLAVTLSVTAAEPNLEGRWWWNLFETPAELRFTGGQLVGGNDFGVFVGAHEYFPAGTGIRYQNLTDGEEDERGVVTVSDTLVVRRQFDLGGEGFSFLNQAGDVMVSGSVSDTQFAGLEILLRQPTAPFTAADLVGQWEYRYLEVPKAVSAPSLTPGTPLNGAFSVETNRFTFTPNGLVTVTATGESLGGLTVIQGLPMFVGGGRQEPFFINRGLDVLLSIKADQTDQDVPQPIYNISLLLRRPDTVTVAEVVGRWHVAELYTPRWLQVGAGPVVEGGSDFGAESFSVTFFPDGRLVDADGEVDTWSLTADGLVQIGDATSGAKFAVNRSKTVAAAATGRNGNTLTLAVKYSDSTGEAVTPTLGLVQNAGQWQLVWSGGILESAPTPSGPWNPVAGATSPRTLVSDGAGAFFRVSSP